jgi:tripartite ATP-independent transporter DctP family solute receptor
MYIHIYLNCGDGLQLVSPPVVGRRGINHNRRNADMKRKQVYALRRLAVLSLALTVLALAAVQASAKVEYVVRIGNIYSATHSIGRGIDKFAELVAEKSGGRVKVEAFHDSILGSEREMAEAVRTRSLEAIVSGLGGVGAFVPDIHVFELPYLYRDLNHLKKVTDTLYSDIAQVMVEKGFRPLTFFYQGPRSVISVRPLRTLSDFKGLKFRVPESPLYVGMARALGADPTPVAFPEVYTALQTGIAHAMEGPPDTVYTNRFHEPAKYYTLTKHIFHVMYLAFNEAYFQSLPKDVQAILTEAAAQASVYQMGLVDALNADCLQKMVADRVTVIEVPDIKPFQDAVKSFNREFATGRGGRAVQLLDKIMAVQP